MDSPHAFAESPEYTKRIPELVWQDRAFQGAEGRSSFCILALSGDDPVGVAVGLINSNHPGQAFLVSMWVAPAYRGLNVAFSLLGKVIDWAVSLGADNIIAGIKTGNARAENFYRKSGFKIYRGNPLPHPATIDCKIVLYKELKDMVV